MMQVDSNTMYQKKEIVKESVNIEQIPEKKE